MNKHFRPPVGNDPLDSYIGNRIRTRRMLLGKSQDQLAKSLGISFQQVQKYERGSNRISASRLYDIGLFLGVPVSFFFADMDETIKANRLKTPSSLETVSTDPATLASRKPNSHGGSSLLSTSDAEPWDGSATDTAEEFLDPMDRTESLELVSSYWKLPSAFARRKVLEMLKAFIAAK